VQEALMLRSAVAWYEVLAAAGVPCSPINSLAQVLSHPHTDASGIIVEYDHASAGHLKGVGHPVRINAQARTAGMPPPALGQHTDEVLSELGLSVERIDLLRNEGVVD
jgi:crotonobetainyl-CoA:carnitine CoA-transferase CaiB-like acyl-CoA transferase